jgi:hypothetical protein
MRRLQKLVPHLGLSVVFGSPVSGFRAALRSPGTARRARSVALTTLACATFALVGCGRASQEASRTAAFVAAGNLVCGEQYDNREVPTYKATVVARYRKVAHEDRNLPSVHKLFSDLKARRRLTEHVGVPLEQVYRLRVKIYDDEEALGMTACTKFPPKAPTGG